MYANSSKALGFAFGIEMWRRLRLYHELPVVTAWGSPLGSSTWANLWIAIQKNSPDVVGRAALAYQGNIPGLFRSFVVDATVDPSNTEDAMEEFSLNVHPARDIRKINAPAAHAIKYEPFLSITEKKEGLKKTVYFDCTSKGANKRIDFERAFPRELQDWVEQNWDKLGFEKPVSITKEKRGEYVMRPVFKSMVD
jgi:3-polyprenyl-4-hydroxybenzoate decarboxylase